MNSVDAISENLMQPAKSKPTRVRYKGQVRDSWLPTGGGHPIPIPPESGEWLERLTWQFAGS